MIALEHFNQLVSLLTAEELRGFYACWREVFVFERGCCLDLVELLGKV